MPQGPQALTTVATSQPLPAPLPPCTWRWPLPISLSLGLSDHLGDIWSGQNTLHTPPGDSQPEVGMAAAAMLRPTGARGRRTCSPGRRGPVETSARHAGAAHRTAAEHSPARSPGSEKGRKASVLDSSPGRPQGPPAPVPSSPGGAAQPGGRPGCPVGSRTHTDLRTLERGWGAEAGWELTVLASGSGARSQPHASAPENHGSYTPHSGLPGPRDSSRRTTWPPGVERPGWVGLRSHVEGTQKPGTGARSRWLWAPHVQPSLLGHPLQP